MCFQSSLHSLQALIDYGDEQFFGQITGHWAQFTAGKVAGGPSGLVLGGSCFLNITRSSLLVNLIISSNRMIINTFRCVYPNAPLTLGHPWWLSKHNLLTDWTWNTIADQPSIRTSVQTTRSYFHTHCLPQPGWGTSKGFGLISLYSQAVWLHIEKYITDSLAAGIIHPSSSPLGTAFSVD